MKSIWTLEDVNLFKKLCPHSFAAYKNEHTFNNYNREDYIYFPKDTSSKIYLIEEGTVKIGHYTEKGEEVIKAILKKGELFGEKAILGEDQRTEFAQSLSNETSVCPIGIDIMREMMLENQPFSLRIYKLIGFRVRRLERRLELLLFKDAETRVREFLKDLSNDYGYECPNTGDTIVKHPYTQKDIAHLIGTSRPTLNTILNKYKELNLIEFTRKEMRLKFEPMYYPLKIS